MAPNSLASGLSGAVFGVALTAAGVYTPSVIINQLKLQDFLMMKVFLTAAASGTLIMQAARRFGVAPCKPRSPTLWGLFPYDGNLVGGLLLGVGMALTGACPGTVLVQLATGVPSCDTVALGAVLGGILYAALPRRVSPSSTQPPKTVYEGLHATELTTVVGFTSLYGLAVLAASWLAPSSDKALLPPVLGGLAIAGAQAASLSLTGNALGVSTAYEQLGHLFWWAVDQKSPQDKPKRPAIGSTVFAAGLFAGAWLLSRMFELPVVEEKGLQPVRAVVGGVLMTFGSRVAGGCTSGHGISGMASLGIASFVTSGAMFGAGVLTGLLFS